MHRFAFASARFKASLGGACVLAAALPTLTAQLDAAPNSGSAHIFNAPTKFVTQSRKVQDSGCSMNEADAMEKELYWEGGTEDPFHPYHRTMDLPTISLEEVQKDHGDQVWVVLNGGVYNVTTFLDAHPGGAQRIQMVSGGDLRKYWDVYKLHDRPHIRALLERYRIGNLSDADAKKCYDQTPNFESYYTDDPERPRANQLRVPTQHPWNSEPPLKTLIDHYYTPNDMFFVRNHNNVPNIDGAEYTLEVSGALEQWGMKEKTYTLADLKTKFPRTEIVSTLQCAGNRQEDFVQRDRPLYVAPHWRSGAIGNAKWAGVRVRDILRDCGVDVDAIALRQKEYPGMKIVNFIGADTDETGTPYAGVLPFEKVVDPFGDALLAYEMNGETLPRDHGYPVRLVAPGHAGCRNVKWVEGILVDAQASELDSGSKLDRHFAPDVGFLAHIRHGEDHIRLDQGPVIQTLPVQSIICEPLEGQTLMANEEGKIMIRGVAWSGAGRGVCRVEVSADGGEVFTAAELLSAPPDKDAPKPECGMGRNWAWQQYAELVELPKSAKEALARGESVKVELVARAIDGDFNQQPEKMSQIWNVLGICVNHWPKVTVTIDPTIKNPEDLPGIPLPPPAGAYAAMEYPGTYHNASPKL